MDEKFYARKMIEYYKEEEKEQTKLEQLKELNKKAKKTPMIFAYVFGVIASLILGTGMCLAMQIIGKTTLLTFVGVGVGLIGIFMVSINYFIYKKLLARCKRKYRSQIISLSNELLNN